jgi:hypothetical protein
MTTIPRVAMPRHDCGDGQCGKREVCRDRVWASGYCAEPHVRAKVLAGKPVLPSDWSRVWWRSGKRSGELGDFQPNKRKGPAPVKEPAPLPVKAVKIRVKVKA